MTVSFNTFSYMADTFYVLFQDIGPSTGSFANYNSTSSLKTLTLNTTGTCIQTESVSYDVSLLLNNSGGYGGNPSDKDGATVIRFT